MRGANEERVVVVVDDERSIREAAESLLKSAGYRAECFASAEDQALRSGAVAFLHKPFAGQDLLDAVQAAIGI
jgi:FixJ family two-component response regulator